jgi:hypothetical protein
VLPSTPHGHLAGERAERKVELGITDDMLRLSQRPGAAS